MQVRNPESRVSLSIVYGNDFQFTWDDGKNWIFYDPLVIRWRGGGSYQNSTQLGRAVWDRVSDLCYDNDTTWDCSIEQLGWIYRIQGDKNDWARTYHLGTGVTESRELFLWLDSFEDSSPERIKRLELIISTTRETAQWILVVSERQFSQFVSLALAVQAFSLSGEYDRIKPR